MFTKLIAEDNKIKKEIERRKKRLLLAKEHAESKCGKCLSSEYTAARDKLIWKCSHKSHNSWQATYDSVVNHGSWCEKCSHFHYKEDILRNMLNFLLETYFEKARPKWNINPQTVSLLELDGYSESLGIAFEYQGEHHYKTGIHGNTEQDLEYIQFKDKTKKENCDRNGIKLLVINYNKKHEFKNFLKEILKSLASNNINFKKINKNNVIELKKIFNQMNSHQQIFLNKAKKLARSKKGECLSKYYIDSKTKLIWKCVCGHIWKKTFNKINSGIWCQKCAQKKRRITLEEQTKRIIEAQIYADVRGGKCLSKKYAKNHILKWCCNQKHIWKQAYYYVIGNESWCRKCADLDNSNRYLNKNGLKLAQEHAKSKGGECLSDKYTGADNYLKWVCSEGHIWEATYSHVVRGGTWCNDCLGRYSPEVFLEKAQEHAKSKGGECLSDKYIDSKSKLVWMCHKKHIWNQLFNVVVHRNSWCPICDGQLPKEERLKLAQEYAKSRGGMCLSEMFESTKTQMKWKCLEHNYEFERTYEHMVGRKRWACIYCKK